MKRVGDGFTIVELLIVIVVIAILAAITTVAYRGVQDAAHNAAVKSDITNFAKQIELQRVFTGAYPAGGRTWSNPSTHVGSWSAAPTGITSFRITKGSYWTPPSAGAHANFIYCTDGTDFAIAAESTSRQFRWSTQHGLQEGEFAMSSDSVGEIPGACHDFAYPRTYSYGFFNGWHAWVE